MLYSSSLPRYRARPPRINEENATKAHRNQLSGLNLRYETTNQRLTNPNFILNTQPPCEFFSRPMLASPSQSTRKIDKHTETLLTGRRSADIAQPLTLRAIAPTAARNPCDELTNQEVTEFAIPP